MSVSTEYQVKSITLVLTCATSEVHYRSAIFVEQRRVRFEHRFSCAASQFSHVRSSVVGFSCRVKVFLVLSCVVLCVVLMVFGHHGDGLNQRATEGWAYINNASNSELANNLVITSCSQSSLMFLGTVRQPDPECAARRTWYTFSGCPSERCFSHDMPVILVANNVPRPAQSITLWVPKRT